MRMTWKKTRTGASSGQGLVELALSLPVLLLILLGTIDVGRMFFDYIEMRNAAREAAGYLARHPDEVGNARAKASNHGGLPADAVVDIKCNQTSEAACAGIKQGDPATADVSITSTFTPLFAGFFTTFFPDSELGSIPLETKASMRVLS